MKKMKLCPKCKKESSQGHICNNNGLKVFDGKISIPREAKKNVFERVKINNNFIFLPSGTQPTGKEITDENYVENLNDIIKNLKKKKEDLIAGCKIEID